MCGVRGRGIGPHPIAVLDVRVEDLLVMLWQREAAAFVESNNQDAGVDGCHGGRDE